MTYGDESGRESSNKRVATTDAKKVSKFANRD